MKEQLISFETAVLAKEKGLVLTNDYYYSLYALGKHKYKESEQSSHKDSNEFVLYNGTILDRDVYPAPMYEPYYFVPSQSLLQKWLREEHHIICNVHWYPNIAKYCFTIMFDYEKPKESPIASMSRNKKYWQYRTDKYEDALEKGLQESLKIIQ